MMRTNSGTNEAKKRETRSERLFISLTPSTLAEVERLAELDNRSRTQFVELAVKLHCERMRKALGAGLTAVLFALLALPAWASDAVPDSYLPETQSEKTPRYVMVVLPPTAVNLDRKDAPPAKELVDEVVLPREHWYQLKHPRQWVYRLEDGELGVASKKLKSPKDRRPFAVRHPKWQAFHDASEWLGPIVSLSGAALPWAFAALASVVR